GTGLFKTCASVMVGTLYKKDDPRRDSGFTIFYMGINLGAFIAPLICGAVYQSYGWHFGFGMGGIGMLIALVIFYFKTIPDFNEFHQKVGLEYDWLKPLEHSKYAKSILALGLIILFGFIFMVFSGFIELNPVSLSKKMIFIILSFAGIYFLYLLFFTNISKEDKKSLIVFIILFLAAASFWGAFEQKPTTFNLFAQDFTDRMIFGFEVPTPWFQSLNPLFIIILAPIIAAIWIKLSKMGFEISSITKFGLGVLGAGLGFGIMILASKSVLANNGASVSMLYITISILFLTLGELCLSPVGLSIMSKIAPKIIKNQVMGLWFVASALGNIVAGLIGGGVDHKNIASLPDLFQTCMFVLFGVAVLLFILKPFIAKMIQKI
ncbi:MFS transporter, partial [Campylobacter sp. MIT 99-7217]|uniref:peptide MFS transporter n=1 Tax=Campylobacter sp. MIT 99-7217 TaxID=535091 RepID=UPI0011588FED